MVHMIANSGTNASSDAYSSAAEAGSHKSDVAVGYSAVLHPNVAAFLDACAQLGQEAPPQSAAWISSWAEKVQPDAVLVTVQKNGAPAFGFALHVAKAGPFKIARPFGLSHSNANFFPISPRLDPSQDAACVAAAIEAVRKARPDIHALVFERLLQARGGRRNPLLTRNWQTSPNIALALDLTPGFEAVLDNSNGKRKRKRYRYHERKLAALGPVRLLRPTHAAEAARVLDAYFEMKAERFRQMGIDDAFGPEPVRDFFRKLFADAAGSASPAFVLDALEVDGKIRAVTGSTVDGDRLICDFAAFANDDSAVASPGDHLLFDNIRNAATKGFQTYDLGVGDEPYKRNWCDIETRHADVFIPLNASGWLYVAAKRLRASLVSFIKGNELLWRTVKSLRARLKAS